MVPLFFFLVGCTYRTKSKEEYLDAASNSKVDYGYGAIVYMVHDIMRFKSISSETVAYYYLSEDRFCNNKSHPVKE